MAIMLVGWLLLVGGGNENARRCAGLSWVSIFTWGRCLRGIRLADWYHLRLILTNMEVRLGGGNIVQRLPEQFIGKSGHGHPALLAHAVESADHIVG